MTLSIFHRQQRPHMHYLFDRDELATFKAFVNRETLLAFDLDGTLTPIVADPRRIRMPPEVRRSLIALCERAPVAIITGRARSDTMAHLGFTPRIVIGNHGAEGLPGREAYEAGFRTTCQSWIAQLQPLLAANPAVFFENKGCTLALHYRSTPDPEEAHRQILQAVARLSPSPNRVTGKFVENLIPASAPHKGEAIQALMRYMNCPRALFVGDDVTDEDVFRLGDPSIFGIHVGEDDWTEARVFVRSQEEVGAILQLLIEHLTMEDREPGSADASQSAGGTS